jgi:Cysteine rich repeat
MRILASAPAFSVLALAVALLGTADWAVAKPTDAEIAAIKASCRSDYMSNCWGVPRGGAEAMQCLKKHLASLSAPCQQAVKAATAPAAAPPAPATPAAAEKPATETKPAAASAESESGSASPAPEGSAEAASPAGSTKSTPSSSKSAGAPQGGSAAKTVPPAAATAAAPAAAPVKPPSEAHAAANPAAAPAEPAALPPIIGFIPPRMKLMLFRNCRDDISAHCSDVRVGGDREIRCLESNLAALTPDCRGALARLSR